jgi:hypothetical protein
VTFHGGPKAARAELNRLQAEARAGSLVGPTKLTVAEHLRRWLSDYAKPNVAAKTLERYEEITERHLIPALGHHSLAKLQPIHVQAYYREALESGRTDGKGSSPARRFFTTTGFFTRPSKWTFGGTLPPATSRKPLIPPARSPWR